METDKNQHDSAKSHSTKTGKTQVKKHVSVAKRHDRESAAFGEASFSPTKDLRESMTSFLSTEVSNEQLPKIDGTVPAETTSLKNEIGSAGAELISHSVIETSSRGAEPNDTKSKNVDSVKSKVKEKVATSGDICIYGTWGAWSECSQPCEGGYQTRYRQLLKVLRTKKECTQSLAQVRECNTQECPCAQDPCQHATSCLSADEGAETTYVCVCDAGWTGQNCDVEEERSAAATVTIATASVVGVGMLALCCGGAFLSMRRPTTTTTATTPPPLPQEPTPEPQPEPESESESESEPTDEDEDAVRVKPSNEEGASLTVAVEDSSPTVIF
eukprot:Selendium_serpulae@DN3298_c0_g1_i1.p2